MSDEITFLDLLALEKITGNTVVERFGSLINSSFFDAQNILGTLKVKGVIDFTTMVPGQNAITVTDAGKQLLAEAAEKAKSQFDQLDLSVLTQLSGGKRTLVDLAGVTNIRPKDMAMHLNKLVEQQFITADIRNGTVNIMLTEKGFLQVKAGMPVQAPTAQTPQQGAPAPMPTMQQAQPTTTQTPMPPMATQPIPAQGTGMQSVQPQTQPQGIQPQPGNGNGIAELEKELKATKVKRGKKITIVVAVIVIIVIVVVLLQRGII